MKRFLIKSIPYILSIVCGIILAYVSIYLINDRELTDLVNDIAASLLAIPVIFLVYDYSDYKTSSKLNNTLTKNLIFEINSVMLKLLMVWRHSLAIRSPLSLESIQKLLNQHAHDMKAKLKFVKQDIDELKSYKEDLGDLIFKHGKSSLLSSEQVLVLSELVKSISHVINENKYGGNKAILAQHVERVMSLMEDWFNTGDFEDLMSHEHFQSASGQGKKPGAAKKHV